MQAGATLGRRGARGRARARPGHPPPTKQLGGSGSAARPRARQPPARASPSAVPEPEASELDDGFSADQRAFLARKAQVAAGEPLADVMPKCDECDGCGMVVCGVCEGTGKNLEDKFEDDGKDAAVLNSAVYVSNRKGHPCWVCRGLATMACGKCDGTGLSTTMDMISGD